MKNLKRVCSLLVLFMWAGNLHAQDFQLQATVSESRIFIGEQFTLDVEVTGSSMRDVGLPVISSIDGVRILSSTPSRSTSISIVNGRTTTSTTYTFNLIAREAGNFTIPPVHISIDGEERSTNPINIEIIERGQLSDDGRRQRPDIYLEVSVDEQNPVPGQQIVASLNLYFRQGIEVTSFQPTAGWRTDGFWKEELQNVRQPQAETVIIDGVRYRTATLMSYALFPSRSGQLTLSEFPLNVGVRSQPSRNDPFGSFFGSGSNQRRVSLESEPVTLNVTPLPVAENAVTMNAVGDLRVERRLSDTEVTAGESIELITVVEGTGNIPLIRRPEYNLPDGLELYTPQESSNVERRGLTIRGDKTFTELMAARAPGTYRIPAERVAVFNPQTRRYNYITLPELRFEALPSQNNQLTQVSLQTARLQPVTGLAVWSNDTTGSVFGSFWFWLLLLIPAAVLVAAYIKRKEVRRLETDIEFSRKYYAEERALERCRIARELVDKNNAKEIYGTLHESVFNFIADRFALPAAGLSDKELLDRAAAKGLPDALREKSRMMLDKCATIRYAPTGSPADFRQDIIKTEALIAELKESI
ncbi:MAG: protein BatD [Balneolaceae bacterium]|nr:protein BatD [Balneolaceae bacterium]